MNYIEEALRFTRGKAQPLSSPSLFREWTKALVGTVGLNRPSQNLTLFNFFVLSDQFASPTKLKLTQTRTQKMTFKCSTKCGTGTGPLLKSQSQRQRLGNGSMRFPVPVWFWVSFYCLSACHVEFTHYLISICSRSSCLLLSKCISLVYILAITGTIF